MFSKLEGAREQRLAERQDLRKRYLPILDIARARFKDTAVVREQEWSQTDVDAARQFLLAAAPFTHPKVFPDLWDHLLISSLYARFLAQDIEESQINPCEAEVMGLIHDDGRLVVPNHYLRNDIVLELGEDYVGVRSEFKAKFFPMEKILGRRKPVNGVQDMTLPQMVIDVADNIGKRKASGDFFTPADTVQNAKDQLVRNQTQYNRSKEALWQSESFGYAALSSGKQELVINLFRQEIDYLGKLVMKKKISIWKRSWLLLSGKQENYIKKYYDNLRQRVEAEFQKLENQKWLTDVKTAQTSLS